MTRVLFLTLLLLGLAGSMSELGVAAANDPTIPALGTRIGFVNTLEVLYATDEGRAEISKIEAFMGQKQEELERMTSELQGMRERFNEQQRTLNPDARAQMQRDIETREVRLKRFQEDTQIEIERLRDELLGRMSDKIQRIIDEYAQERNLGAIFLRDQSQAYVAPSLDLTEEIVRLFNERNPEPGSQP